MKIPDNQPYMKGNKPNPCLIIFGDSFSFPEGNAATNRVYSYAKGFLENEIQVYVICFASVYNTKEEGSTEGIKFYHPFAQRKRSKYFLIRRYHNVIKYFNTIKLFNKINNENNIIAINSWTFLFITHLFSWFLSKKYKTKLIKECSEHPLRYYQKFELQQKVGIAKFWVESTLSDGLFCISQFLIDFHAQYKIGQQKLFLVPSTVDIRRFNKPFDPPLPYKYILYCGTVSIQKDGVNILIESFSKIAKKFTDINLVIIGEFTSSKEEHILVNLVSTLEISNRVIFLGQLSREDIPAYLTNAEILALARPKSIVSDAGFPSKLTEYLATGVPVVATKVGDIPVYLNDNENAFLSEPDSVSMFADKLDKVLTNYEFAQDVALKGKELTNTIFNYNYQSKRMMEYIGSLK
jgi:glycosyltransferase involved in cell wall biosynthesis